LIDIAVESKEKDNVALKNEGSIVKKTNVSTKSDKKIILKVENAIMKKQHSKSSGVAIINTKRRLALLYPNRHTLTITETTERYSVVLEII
jgi:LytS/YehU family sensor histidine kinase